MKLPLQRPQRMSLVVLLSVAVSGCTPRVDESGWEIARKKSPSERLETYPELPVILPGAIEAPSTTATGTPIEAVLKNSLDVGSLFRRGYSAPTP
jgi:hypothetical protein